MFRFKRGKEGKGRRRTRNEREGQGRKEKGNRKEFVTEEVERNVNEGKLESGSIETEKKEAINCPGRHE